VFNIDLNQTVHDLEWEGDKGLANLWGLYYKCPDTQFMRTFKLNGATGAASAPGERKMKDSAKITEDVHQEYHEPHCSRPNSDDATTAATTFSSSITSLTPGTTASSSMDALIKYNADFQNALEKHCEDILCLIRNCAATSGRPAIATKMIGKVREANLATMKSINKKASHHGGKEITTKKIKELGAQAEKEAVAMFDAKTKQNSTMEQEEPPLAN
jgi:hypothetical protein